MLEQWIAIANQSGTMGECEFLQNSTCFAYDLSLNDSYNDSVPIWPSCTDGVPGMLSSAYFQAAIYLTYTAIFVVALLGNGLVCYVVLTAARMRTVTNLFIANMAVGDIMMTVLCVPFSFVSTLILQYWPFGAPLCHTVSFSQAVSVLVSAYTLVAISVDRYMAIMWPLRPRMSKQQAKVVILLVWMVALATALPIPLVTRLDEPSPWHASCQRSVCNEHWDSNRARVMYGVTLLVLQYAIPFLVLVFTYTSIAVVVWGKRPPGEAEGARDMRIARSKRKMVKMMITIVVVFTTCWLPFNILLVVWSNDESLGEWEGLPYMWFAFHWLAMSHTCYNPIIYCWMNTRFRAGFCSVLGRVVPGEMRTLQSTAMTENSVIPRINTVSGTRYLHTSNCFESSNKIVKFHEDMI